MCIRMKTKLNSFDSSTFDKKAGKIKIVLWLIVNAVIFRNPLVLIQGIKKWLLRLFGAQLGKGLVIKPGVNIKFPWKLKIGDHVWIGENVWIDNLDEVVIGDHVCISQGALLLTGNHNYTKTSFDYRNAPIELEDGVWVGAKAVVCPGVTCKSHAILTVSSVATSDLEAYYIYQGNPAYKVRKRILRD